MRKNINVGSKMVFITSFPSGRAILVEILGENPRIRGGYYIRKPNGSSDTTTAEFLYELEGLDQ